MCSRCWLLSVLRGSVRCFLWLFVRCACLCDLPPLLVAFDRVVGVSTVHLWVLGGCHVAGLDFDELRACLLSYVLALLVVVGAA